MEIFNIIKDKKVTKVLNHYIKTVEGHRSSILSNFGVVANKVTEMANWFSTGVVHSTMATNFETVSQKVQDRINSDLPTEIDPAFQYDLYQDLVREAIFLGRRLELLGFIEVEIDRVQSMLSNQCKRE